MAFLFKSKKNQQSQDRGLTSRDGPPSSSSQQPFGGPSARIAREDKGSLSRSTPTGSLNSLDNDGSGSPDQGYARRAPSNDQGPQQPVNPMNDLQLRNGATGTANSPNNPNTSLYPWSQRRLTYTSSHPSPFPRYGAAVNSTSSKEGDIYVMGGLINSQTVKGDLWMIEAGGSMACYPLATTAEGPGPRVGHSSLLVGNAFIVYGGDTKIDESDALDETLYLLNTSTRQWSRALPAGQRPSGRYGHSLNLLGSKIYIFGGQVEGYFMNDLAAFDLNQLQMPNNRWEMLILNSDSPNPPPGKIPPARTNHSVIAYNDKLYLFGGTNGFQWFNDVWCYDPVPNTWSLLDCIGYIPVAREGHAASLVDDVMYIFGGRNEEGADLGDLAAFRISSKRWYTFQNMGPSPSPRSGHSMTTVGKSVVVVGGEPSSAATTVNDLGLVYLLDTSKIRYPNDAQIQQANAQRAAQGSQPGSRRPSQSDAPIAQSATRSLSSRDGSQGPSALSGPMDPKKLIAGREGVVNSPTNGYRSQNGPEMNGPPVSMNTVSKLPRAAGVSAPAGPPPQREPPNPGSNVTSLGRVRNPSLERNDYSGSPTAAAQNQSPINREPPKDIDSPTMNGRRTPTQQVSKISAKPEPAPIAPIAPTQPVEMKPKLSVRQRGQGSVDSSTEPALKSMAVRPSSPPPPTRQNSNPLSRRSSTRNSQTVALLKELDAARNRNAWYASELELARKSGYTANASLSPVLDSRGTETFDDDDKPLIEALLAMRAELANVQSSVDKQAVIAAKQIAEAEKQRDAAIQEAVYAKAKFAAHVGNSADNNREGREGEINRKLVVALSTQREFQSQIDRLVAELEAERRARRLADDTTGAAQRRMVDLENFKQRNTSDVERLKAELHRAQREAREQSVAAAEAVAAAQMLRVEKDEFQTRYNEAAGSSKSSSDTLDSLRAAVVASADVKALLERRVEEERAHREKAESKLNKLKVEHEARTAELVSATQRLRDAEELAEKHANEARTHRQAVLSGLDKFSVKDTGASNRGDSDRIVALQGQLNAANAMVKRYQQEADAASDRLRSAEERIAGLEAYQEQASREGVTIRRQLQGAMKETQSLQALNSDLRQQLASQQLETNAVTVQHNTLKDILSERGISPINAARMRGSPRGSSPEQPRQRDLEQQLATAIAAHEETKQNYALSANESESAYRDKLTQLENDYQSAVHYVKGTEKMLKQLKEQLAKYKTENSKLKTDIEELEERGTPTPGRDLPTDWENQRTGLTKQVDSLQAELNASRQQLEKQMLYIRSEVENAMRDRDAALKSNEDVASRLTTSQRDFEQLQQENSLLEQRALDAENKVGMLLDQVAGQVEQYRRRSRQVASMNSDQLKEVSAAIPGTNGQGHARQESSESGSVYGTMDNARNSTALDNLANELESLRSHWETTSKNYRLSNTFDFESNVGGATKKEAKDDESVGLSESLADWRKRLDD